MHQPPRSDWKFLGPRSVGMAGNVICYSPADASANKNATSADGVNWLPQNRKVLQTNPPFPTASTPSGPYHFDIFPINSLYVFIGWIGSSANLAQQGLWAVTSSTLDGSKSQADFRLWSLVLNENNGTYWHD